LGELFNIYNNIFVPIISFYRRQLHVSAFLNFDSHCTFKESVGSLLQFKDF